MTHSIIVEMRPRLQVCNIFLVTKEYLKNEESVKINIKSTGVDVTWLSESSEIKQVINLSECKLKPLSLSSLQVQKNSVSFRVQTEPLINTSGSFSSEILPFDQSLNVTKNNSANLTPCIPINTPSTLICKCCGRTLIKQNISFARVLPLPSSASLNACDWFCHQHSGSSDIQKSELTPKESDCFYGLCFLVLSTSLLNNSSGKVIRCNRCMSWLGTCSGSAVKLWNCTTVYEGNKNATALEDFVLTVKDAFATSFGITCCRLLLETRLSDKISQYLLIWAMDKNLSLLVGLTKIFLTVKETVGQLEKVKVECKLKAKKTMKLLYMFHESYNDIVKSWEDDNNVQCVEVAKQMFNEGLQYLVEGTEKLPTPHKMTPP